jgi:hypothetical protein
LLFVVCILLRPPSPPDFSGATNSAANAPYERHAFMKLVCVRNKHQTGDNTEAAANGNEKISRNAAMNLNKMRHALVYAEPSERIFLDNLSCNET